jgi:hypothetical protein
MNVAVIVIVYVAAVILLLKPWSRSPSKTRPQRSPVHDPYRSVSLACDSESCQEVALVDGRRFLVDDAPDIPLQQCAERTCSCRYVHHADRRGVTDRRLVAQAQRAEAGETSERRDPRGRRKSDWSLLAVSGG